MIVAALAIYSLVYDFTHERKTAVLAAMIAEFAWQLPSFAINWGKYPALADVLFPIAYAFILKFKPERKKSFVSVILLMTLLIGNFLFHSRILFCVLFAFIGWGFVLIMERSSVKVKFTASALIAIALLVLILTDQEGLANYYGGKFVLVILLAILLRFQFIKFPTLVCQRCYSFISIFGFQNHFNMVFNGSATPVIDSTFSTMSLFILSIITATGVTGITNLMPANYQR